MDNFELRKAEQSDVVTAIELAMKEYENEAGKCPELFQMKSEENEIRKSLSDLITNLFSSKFSYVAYNKKVMIGYIGFWGPIDGFFGNVKGAFSPLGGSAFTGSDRNKISSILLSYAMQEMVKDEVLTVALSRYADDEEVGKALVLNGFGIRCADAIRSLNYFPEKINEQPNITYCELPQNEYEKIKELNKELCRHLLLAPTFFPTFLEEAFPEKKVKTESRVFVAKDTSQDKIIGYIRVGDDGETVFADLPSVKNICGTYVDSSYRNHNIAEGLLFYVAQTLKKEGAKFLGVDCETLNPTALRFWAKNFQNYTYSYARRLDERVIGYDNYWNDYWK